MTKLVDIDTLSKSDRKVYDEMKSNAEAAQEATAVVASARLSLGKQIADLVGLPIALLEIMSESSDGSVLNQRTESLLRSAGAWISEFTREGEAVAAAAAAAAEAAAAVPPADADASSAS